MGGDGLCKYETGAMEPPSIIPSKALNQHVIGPQHMEPSTLMPYRKAKHARHGADYHSLFASGHRPVMHHGHYWMFKQLQILSKLDTDITQLWSDLSTRFCEQHLLAHQMHPYITKACNAEKFNYHDEWGRLLTYMQAMDQLLAQYAQQASRLENMQVTLKNAQAGNKSLGTSTTSHSLLEEFRSLYRSGTDYRNALLFGVSSCIEAETDFGNIKHACIHYNSKPSSIDAGSDGIQKHQYSEHQPLPVTCPVVEDSRHHMLNRAPPICSLGGKKQNLWPAGTFAGKAVMSAVVDLDPDS